ncbi:MAG: hypothetical protein PHY82_07960 [Lentisphaeria bacterium]|nr:hypothetical protein [Lentisphaeria bacterium]
MHKRSMPVFYQCLLVFLLLIPLAYGQRRSRFSVKEGGSLKLKLETMRAPEFKDSKQGIAGCAHWGVVSLDFELDNDKDEWVDELEVYCLILAQQKGGTAVALEQSFRYMDVCGGDKNHVLLFITPTFFRRYLDNSKRPDTSKLSAYVELRVGGSPIHKSPIFNTAAGLPKDWYQQAGRIKRIANALLPKSRTPFASVDFDYYLYELPAEPQ